MAYDKTNKKLYVAEGSGITPWEVAQCLDDYRVNSKGQRDVGMLCMSPNINPWAKFKPFYSIYPAFASDTVRENARRGVYYGTMPSTDKCPDNDTIDINSDYVIDPRIIQGYKRLLDFDGYCHTAVDGINIKNADSYSISSGIILDVNPATGDNLSVVDFLKVADAESAFDRFAWVLINPWGFWYILKSFSTLDAFESYVNATSGKEVLYIDDYREALSTWYQNGILNSYSPPRQNHEWVVGLAGIKNTSAPTANFQYEGMRLRLFNSLRFTDNKSNSSNIILRLSGLTPNTVIGSVAGGKHHVYDTHYADTIIDCCQNDLLFLGITVANNSAYDYTYGFSTVINAKTFKLDVVIRTSAGTFYASVIQLNTQTTTVPAGTTKGSTGEANDQIWSDGMFCVSLANIWNIIGDAEEFHLTVNHNLASSMVCPYIKIRLRNNGRFLSDLSESEKLAVHNISANSTWTQKQ